MTESWLFKFEGGERRSEGVRLWRAFWYTCVGIQMHSGMVAYPLYSRCMSAPGILCLRRRTQKPPPDPWLITQKNVDLAACLNRLRLPQRFADQLNDIRSDSRTYLYPANVSDKVVRGSKGRRGCHEARGARGTTIRRKSQSPRQVSGFAWRLMH